MAAVTVANRVRNFDGAFRQVLMQVSGNDGDYVDVGFYNIRNVLIQQGPISGYTLTAATPVSGSTRITFSATGAFTTSEIEVKGR